MRPPLRILPFLLFILPGILKAGSCDSMAFYKTITSSSGMHGSTQMMANAPSGNFYVLTNILGPGNFGNGVTTGSSGMFLVKYNSGGHTCWARQVSSNSMNGARMALDAAENLYISMHYSGNISILNVNLTSTSSTYDIFLAKMDSTSNPLWIKSFGGAGTDLFGDISISGSTLRLTGQSNNGLSFGSCNLTANYNYVFIASMDTAGNCQAAFDMKTSNASQLRLRHDISGNVFLSLRCASLDVGGGTQTAGNSPAVLLKFSSAHTLQWLWMMKASNSSYFFGTEVDEQGNAYALTSFNGLPHGLVSLNNQQQISLGTNPNKIIKISAQGSFCWEKELYVDNAGATQYSGGRIRLSGRFGNIYGGGYAGSFQGVGYTEFDTSGVPVFVHVAQTSANAIPMHIFATASGRVVLGMHSNTNTYIGFRNAGQNVNTNLFTLWAFDRTAQSPVPVVPTDSTIVCGANIQLNLAYHYGKTYNWFPVTDLISPNTNYPEFRNRESRTYSMRSTEQGCTVDSSSFEITVNPLNISARSDTSVFCGETIRVSATTTATGNYAISWNPAIGSGLSFNHTLNSDKTISVRISSTGCTSAYDTVNLSIIPITKFLRADTSAYCGERLMPGLADIPTGGFYYGPLGGGQKPILDVNNQVIYPFYYQRTGCPLVYDTIRIQTKTYINTEQDTSVICGSQTELGLSLPGFLSDNYQWTSSTGGWLGYAKSLTTYIYGDQTFARVTSNAGCPPRIDSIRVKMLPYEVHLPEVVSLFCADTMEVNVNGPTGFNHYYSWQGSNSYLIQNATKARLFPKQDSWHAVFVQNPQCGSDWDSIFVDVIDLPLKANAGADRSMPCDTSVVLNGSGTGSPYLKYSWTPSLGLSNTKIANPVAKPVVTSLYKLAVYVDGCNSDTDEVRVTVLNPNPPDPGITSSSGEFTLCDGGITLSGKEGFKTYLWNTGSSGRSIHIQQSGIYTLQVIESSGCGNQQSVEIKPLFDLKLPDGNYICTNQTNFSVRLQGPAGMDSYVWNTGSQVQNISVGTPGMYLLSATKGSCTYTDTAVISDHPGFTTADFSYSKSGAVFDFTLLTASPKFFAWDFGDGSISTERNPQHTYTSTGTYDVCLELTDVCGATDDICKTVSVTSLVGLTDAAEEPVPSVYPNPSTGSFYLSGADHTMEDLRLYDIRGREVGFDLIPQTESSLIRVNNLTPGLYLLRVKNRVIKISIY